MQLTFVGWMERWEQEYRSMPFQANWKIAGLVWRESKMKESVQRQSWAEASDSSGRRHD